MHPARLGIHFLVFALADARVVEAPVVRGVVRERGRFVGGRTW